MLLQGQAVPWLVTSGHLEITLAEGLGGLSLLIHFFVRFPRELVGIYRAVYPPLEVRPHRGGATGY